jgi:hypothetical protein
LAKRRKSQTWTTPRSAIFASPRDDDGRNIRAPARVPALEVNAYVDFTGNEVLPFHRIQNISLGGVCIQTAGVEEVGTLVDLR